MQDPSASTPSQMSKLALRNAFIVTETALLAQSHSSSVRGENEMGKRVAQISNIFPVLKGLGEGTHL